MTFALGCDVSAWQNRPDTPKQVDFTKMKSNGASFCFLKATQGLSTDTQFLNYRKLANEANIPWGAYCFIRFNADPGAQARYMWELIKDDPGQLPIVADFEAYKQETPPATAANYLWGFVDTIERLSGRAPIIYSRALFIEQYIRKTSTAWRKYPLWVAHYYVSQTKMESLLKRTPWDRWDFWQYSDKADGLAYGVESLQVDVNYFHGTEAELHAKFIKTPPIVPIPPVEPSTEEKINKLWDYHPELH
jgi:GH25 family lysozyme M1 (1,4-beta-N-acetylmuramidase)